MKVCKEHIHALHRGITYELVSKDKCEICKLIKKYGW